MRKNKEHIKVKTSIRKHIFSKKAKGIHEHFFFYLSLPYRF